MVDSVGQLGRSPYPPWEELPPKGDTFLAVEASIYSIGRRFEPEVMP